MIAFASSQLHHSFKQNKQKSAPTSLETCSEYEFCHLTCLCTKFMNTESVLYLYLTIQRQYSRNTLRYRAPAKTIYRVHERTATIMQARVE